MQKFTLLGMAFFFSILYSFTYGQYGDFGLPEQPEDTAAVDDLIDYGPINNMAGGYHVGDTVFDFTLYDFDGNSINLYDQLALEKPVILINGSVSCLRFRNTFEIGNTSQEYLLARSFLTDYQNQFNWIFVYGIEAHPTDGNCPSNCPPTTSTDTTVIQAPDYAYRRWSVHSWLNSTEHDFPFNMYADNPDNAVYNNFFARPYGLLAINCDGTVAVRGDWVNSFFMDVNQEMALMQWAMEHEVCAIDWEPIDDSGDDSGDDDGTGDPIYTGPTHALLNGFGEMNGSSNGISGQEADHWVVAPNPAHDILQIRNIPFGSTLTIFDMTGRVAQQWEEITGSVLLETSSMQRGIYVVALTNAEGKVSRQHVILQ